MPRQRQATITSRRTVQELFQQPSHAAVATAAMPAPAPAPAPAPVISLGTLATSLGCTVARLLPLAEHGLLRLHSAPPLSSQSFVEALGEPALLWLRGWLQPAQAKPLLSQQDMAALLEVSVADVAALAAQHNVPAVWEPALGGLVFSVWAARQLLLAAVQGRPEAGPRWDRAALVAMLLEGDPEAMLRPASMTYSEAIDAEIARVAALPEPSRGLRAAALLEQFEDARRVCDSARTQTAATAAAASAVAQASVATSPSGSFELPACEHAPERFARQFARLRHVSRPSARSGRR